MADKPIGFVFNQQLLTMILGVIALCGSIYAGVSWMNDRVYFEQSQTHEITQLKANDAAQVEANKELTSQIGRLGDSVDDLALSLKEVEVIQRTQPLTGLNVTPMPNLR